MLKLQPGIIVGEPVKLLSARFWFTRELADFGSLIVFHVRQILQYVVASARVAVSVTVNRRQDDLFPCTDTT